VALAPEEAREPHRTIPRGLTLAQITLVVLVILTWFFATAAGEDYLKTGAKTFVSTPIRVRAGLAQIDALIVFSIMATHMSS
jgi:amino acid transporter